MAALNLRVGRSVETRTVDSPMKFEGVGKGSQTCAGIASVPICVPSESGVSEEAKYEAEFTSSL